MDETRRRFLRLGGLTAVGTLAGCAGPPGTETTDGTTVDARGQDTLTVTVGAFAFDSPAVWVDPGTTVTWEWTGSGGSHNIVAADDVFRSGDPTGSGSYEHVFESEGTHTYYCDPHRGVGMRGAVVVGQPGSGSQRTREYDWQAATFDSYWYSLRSMSTNIAVSSNGVPFPLNDQMEQLRDKRLPAIIENADTDRPPIANPNLSLASFTEGDPHFTQQPVFDDGSGRPDASTLAWDKSESSDIASPSSVGWTHLKGVTWAKNFQAHFDILPADVAPKFRAQLLATPAQVGINAAILVGGSRGNGALTRGDSFEFLSDMNSLAQNGWFGYVNPRPLLPKEAGADAVFDPPVGIQGITDGVASATMDLYRPEVVVSQESPRSAGLMLGAVGYYGPQAGTSDQLNAAADYANGLAGVIEDNLAGNGKVRNGVPNQAATQGIVAQGLLWASQSDGVDYTDTAADVVGYITDQLWDGDAGTSASGEGDDTYTITARDAGDITGGINAADTVPGMGGIKDTSARFFAATFNTGRLQRAQRQPSVGGRENEPPLPPEAGGTERPGRRLQRRNRVRHREWRVVGHRRQLRHCRRALPHQLGYLGRQLGR